MIFYHKTTVRPEVIYFETYYALNYDAQLSTVKVFICIKRIFNYINKTFPMQLSE